MVENWRQFSASKLGTDFQNVRHAQTTPIFYSDYNVFSSDQQKQLWLVKVYCFAGFLQIHFLIFWLVFFFLFRFATIQTSKATTEPLPIFRPCPFLELNVNVSFWHRTSSAWHCSLQNSVLNPALTRTDSLFLSTSNCNTVTETAETILQVKQ